ncbi:MAG TPA: RNA-guided endonuclease TnpB family protein, partial [Candidatus Baltobacteraceae bacterium]|nr:RNA-guided endonuclease TnpB family protein [Candidatus Baltobacteraceae bacterium]
MALSHKVYRFRLEPTVTQARGLVQQAGARRWVWNWALARRRTHYQATQTSLSFKELSTELTAVKHQPATAWLQTMDSQLLQQSLRDLQAAFSRFFAKDARFPRFKSRKRDRLRFRIPQRVQLKGSRVYVPKVGWVRIRQSQPVLEPTRSATFAQDAVGQWFVTLTVEHEIPEGPTGPPATVVGIDLGLTTAAVLSDGTSIPAPRCFRTAERTLAKAQRAVSRKHLGSMRRRKATQQVARVYQRTTRQRQDFLHKLTTQLVTTYDAFCLEDLSVTGLARTKLAKSVLDAAPGEFRRQLAYKAQWAGKPLLVVDRFFPSSKRCSACGTLKADLTLKERVWTCAACGTHHERDHNAALNLRDEGLRLLAVGHPDSHNAQGDCVSPGTPGNGR